jgi:Xaa-Pro aminopeptidase
MDVSAIQAALQEQGLDGWLFFDHHERDPLAYRVLGFSAPRTPTRRWFYLIPASGEPRGLVHVIEAGMLDLLPGEKLRYSGWHKLESGLRALLSGCRTVAMQYSPGGAVPYVSMVDAGTVEMIRSLGVEVRTSADLIQFFEARWSDAQYASHVEAGRRVDRVRAAAFAEIGARIGRAEPVTEFQIQRFILDRFQASGLVTGHGPIVAVNANASNPHYEPAENSAAEIRRGHVVLIDLWAKLAGDPDSVYYDVTWMGSCGAPAERVVEVFRVVAGARDAAVERVRGAIAAGQPLYGFEVDDTARGFISARGFGDYFIHRTGHSIGRDVHGAGANMDNLETHDERRIIPRTCFSVEPGIYLPEFGVRSEVNIYVGEREAGITGALQKELIRICD